jgi:hypothetical protein
MVEPGRKLAQEEETVCVVRAAETRRPRSGITLRAVGLSLLLIPLNAFMLVHIEVVRHQAYPTSYAIFGNVVAFLAVLTLLNAGLRRWLPRFALTPPELITCYILLCAASAVGNDQFVFLLVSMIAHTTWFNSTTNHWAEQFGSSLPPALTVQNKEVLRGFYLGVSSAWRWDVMTTWLPPLCLWIVFLLALVWVMLCINTLVRQPWTEAQRLTFPLITLPIQMADPREGLFRSRWMWWGLGITAVLNLVNGLHVLFPTVPEIPRYIDLAQFWPTGRPWDAFQAFPNARIPIGIFPFIFGLGLLMPLDLVFSCWVFYVLTRLAAVAQAARGWDTISGFPFDVDMASGAFVGIFGYSLWQLRGHWRRVARKVLYDDPEIDDRGEPMRYRTAVIGTVLGGAFLVFFATRAGMSLSLSLAFFVAFFAFSLVVTRIRAEAGVTSHDVYLGGPDVLLVNGLGTERLSRGDLMGLSLMFWYNRGYDSHPMPHQLEGFRMAEKSGMALRGLPGLMLLGIGAGAIASVLVMLHVMYQLGAASGKVVECVTLAGEPWNRLGTWIASPSSTNWYAMSARGVGLLLTAGLFAVRNAGIWCPFHPIGVAMAGSWAMYKIWSSLMFSWMVKAAVLKYGGRRHYGTLVHFGLGLVLGDCILGGFWAIIGAANNVATFGVWP